MESLIKDKILPLVKKNLVLIFILFFILGAGTMYIILEKKLNQDYALEVNSSENTDTEELHKINLNGKIYVDLSGAVNSPGVFELEYGSRVGDLLSLGGGAGNDASAQWISRNLNLSKILEDSSKIYIPFEWEFYFPEVYEISKTVNKDYASITVPNNSSSSTNTSSKVDTVDYTDVSDGDSSGDSSVDNSGKTNVNTASSSELDELPGIGPAYAEKIISNRPYVDLPEFETKSGLYKSTIENIKDLISF